MKARRRSTAGPVEGASRRVTAPRVLIATECTLTQFSTRRSCAHEFVTDSRRRFRRTSSDKSERARALLLARTGAQALYRSLLLLLSSFATFITRCARRWTGRTPRGSSGAKRGEDSARQGLARLSLRGRPVDKLAPRPSAKAERLSGEVDKRHQGQVLVPFALRTPCAPSYPSRAVLQLACSMLHRRRPREAE